MERPPYTVICSRPSSNEIERKIVAAAAKRNVKDETWQRDAFVYDVIQRFIMDRTVEENFEDFMKTMAPHWDDVDVMNQRSWEVGDFLDAVMFQRNPNPPWDTMSIILRRPKIFAALLANPAVDISRGFDLLMTSAALRGKHPDDAIVWFTFAIPLERFYPSKETLRKFPHADRMRRFGVRLATRDFWLFYKFVNTLLALRIVTAEDAREGLKLLPHPKAVGIPAIYNLHPNWTLQDNASRIMDWHTYDVLAIGRRRYKLEGFAQFFKHPRVRDKWGEFHETLWGMIPVDLDGLHTAVRKPRKHARLGLIEAYGWLKSLRD